ncbi:MAG: DNA primase [Treponema sp.]|nr:DNA primase [Treponema sp.]
MAGFISKDTIEKVRESVDIVSLIGDYTNLTRRGSQYWGCCPFHNEKTPSFTVDSVKKFYHCFGCGVGGDAIKFVMEMESLSYPDAISELAKKNNIEVTYESGSGNVKIERDADLDTVREVYDRIASTFHFFLTQNQMGREALEYIKGRGLSEETISKFKLGYAPSDRTWLKKFLLQKNYSAEFLSKTGLFSKNYPDIALFSGRLIFPIFDRKGEAVAFGGRILGDADGPKYLNSPELPHYKKRETLYAFNFAKKSIQQKKTVILCEGYMDVIAYHQCGIDNAVAPLGTSLTEQQLKILQGFADTVLLSFDSDGAGQNATKRAILMCREFNFTTKIIRLSGAKDPAEIMIKFGPETLTKSVENAMLDSDFLLSKLKESYPSDSPDDKTKAALAFFSYVDSLRSDIQKESSLEQLAQSFNLAPEAVKRDFNNRSGARGRLNAKTEHGQDGTKQVKPNAELRAVLAVISNPDEYQKMRRELTSDDFEDPMARELFLNLEECYRKGEVSLSAMLVQSQDEEIQRQITGASASDEFHGDMAKYIDDSIALIKRKSLKRKSEKLSERIKELRPVTSDDETLLQELILEKTQIDKHLRQR